MTDRFTETELFLEQPVDTRGADEQSLSGLDYLDAENEPPARGQLTLLNGLALVISLQIGSGIFTAPSQISQFVATPGYGLLVWLFGGVMVWTGAASFIELGLRIPNNGGIQEYLRVCYGDFMGFLFTWSWVVIAKPCANAIIATIFADYLTNAFVSQPVESLWILKLVAVGCIGMITCINCLGSTAGAKVANLFLVLKLGALGSIIAIGGIVWFFGYGEGVQASEDGWFGWTRDQADTALWDKLSSTTTALFGALFCYGGWESVSPSLTHGVV
jgi:solute carrier family 7 (L-type amino acid transporter), member 6